MKSKVLLLLAAFGIVFSTISQSESSVIKRQEIVKVTIMYPNGADATFNMDYYREKHMPMLAELFDGIMLKYEIDQGIRGRTSEDQLPYLAIGYLYFNSISDYEKAFGPNAEKILGDIPNYTNIQPTVQISQVIK